MGNAASIPVKNADTTNAEATNAALRSEVETLETKLNTAAEAANAALRSAIESLKAKADTAEEAANAALRSAIESLEAKADTAAEAEATAKSEFQRLKDRLKDRLNATSTLCADLGAANKQLKEELAALKAEKSETDVKEDNPLDQPPSNKSINAAAEASATSSLGVDHASKLSAIPTQAEVDALAEAAARHLREVAKRLGLKETTRDGVCKALVTAFLDMIPMPKNDDHSDVSLGPLLDNFKDVKSDARVQAHDNDSLRLLEEKFRIAHTTSTDNDDGAVDAATKDLRVAVQKMEPAMREVITEAIGKTGRTLEWVRVTNAGNSQFSKVYRSVFEYIEESEQDGIQRYQEVIARLRAVLPGGKAPLQGPDNLVDLYAEAARAQPGFKATMEVLKLRYRARTKGKELKLSVCRKLKKVTRILEKMIMRGSVKGVKDIVRAMATLDDMDNIAIVAELMLELHQQKVINLLRIKERFFEQPSSGGWRDLMINFTIGEDRHIVELQIAHAKMLTARKGLPGHAVYGKTRNCIELLTMERGSADVAGLADFFRDFVDDVKTLDSEALQRVPHWFHDDVPVCDWEGITADDKGRITDLDVRVADPEFIGGECQLPNLKRVPLCYMGKDNYGKEKLQGVKLVTTAYLRALTKAHPGVDITCGGKMRLTAATCNQSGIGAALKPFGSHVRHFDIKDNGLGPEGGKALAPALQAMTGLKSLDLERNELGPEGGKALAPALQALTGLKSLNLHNNKLGPEAGKALAPALQAMTGLESLDLGGNNLKAEACKALAPALQALTGLESLDLGDNNLGPEGGKALAPALQALTGLKSLNLAWNNLKAEAGKALAPALQALTGLESLDLGDNDLSDDDKSELKTKLQNIKTLGF